MAVETSIKLRNQVLYSIYVRNHTKEGTFQAIESDLDRIRKLGTDIIWLLPIHPIGIKNKKGDLGCPYAIRDYREVNPEYGTKEDFIHLVKEIHERGMKCMIDVVYNHTSPDSKLYLEHPDYFYKKENGQPGNKTGDWHDVIDLDYSVKELWAYQIESLCMWAEIVDGFRCDVAPLIPLDFWKEAREAVDKVKKDFIWLAETVEIDFIRDNRRRGLTAHSDGEMYQAFDAAYDYDVYPYFNRYLQGTISLSDYVEFLNFQNGLYPSNYVKLRCLENHDRPRAKRLISNENRLRNWTAFLYFQKGMTLIYAGQELENTNTPSLFDLDKVDWNTGNDLSGLMQSLYEMKQRKIISEGDYYLQADDGREVIIGSYQAEDEQLIGIFQLMDDAQEVQVSIDVPDGEYLNILDGTTYEVKSGSIWVCGKPIVLDIWQI